MSTQESSRRRTWPRTPCTLPSRESQNLPTRRRLFLFFGAAILMVLGSGRPTRGILSPLSPDRPSTDGTGTTFVQGARFRVYCRDPRFGESSVRFPLLRSEGGLVHTR